MRAGAARERSRSEVSAVRRTERVDRPEGYPAEYERDLLLADGRRVHVRPVVPADLPALAEAIGRADPETIRRRFLGGGPPRSTSALRRLVELDYRTRFALAAFDADGQGVGIARYEGERTWPAVELAVAVDPAWREVGLGRELVRLVVERAAEQGAATLTADFFSDNRRVQDLIAESGLTEQRTVEHGVVQDVLPLRAP
jgi:RimJ/RimL family protein N-acetyltransferase